MYRNVDLLSHYRKGFVTNFGYRSQKSLTTNPILTYTHNCYDLGVFGRGLALEGFEACKETKY